jgi:hypothetical protein
MQVAIAQNFPSRYDIGDVVYFHPSVALMNMEEAREYAIMAQVSSVTFREGKVTYELYLNTGKDGEINFYQGIPVADVDSYYVTSEDDLQAVGYVRNTDIGSSGEMVGMARSIDEKLQRLAERRCPEDPEGEMKRLDEYARDYMEKFQALSSTDRRKCADRFSAIKADLVN